MMDEEKRSAYGVDFAEASKITLEYVNEKMRNGTELDERRAVSLMLTGADALARVLVRTICDPLFEHKYPVPCYMLFPAAFKIAEKAWEKLMEQGAPEGFLEDAIPAVAQIVQWSEEEGLLFRADEIKRKVEEMRGAKNGE